MLAKINKITNWQAAAIIAVIGFAAYCRGLFNPFMGDDIDQIVNNVPVHSLSNFFFFFRGSTFYNGQGLAAPLSGVYYRPLQTTVFSLLYTLFGNHSFYFHLLQLLLCIGSAILLYIFFRNTFKPALSLFLALIFLIHPLNSQVVYSIPYMQDVLMFFFGILALNLVFRFKSARSLILVAFCLFFSLLAKETGILFVILAAVYLFWFNRKRLLPFLYLALPLVIVWFSLRLHAVGLDSHSTNAPIDSLNLADRLMTAPSIMLFYITKLVFPWKLASSYFWVYPTFSVRHVLLPLIIDLSVIALVIFGAYKINQKAPKAQFRVFLFFALWSTLGLGILLQIIPLDMTACEVWFYFTMAGVLGMIGVVVKNFKLPLKQSWLVFFAVLLLLLLGVRTSVRASDWSSVKTLAIHDIAASKEDYTAYFDLAGVLIEQGKFAQAEPYIINSIKIHPYDVNYYDYGLILGHLKNYSGAKKAYDTSLIYGDYIESYEELAELTLIYGNAQANYLYLNNVLNKFSQDSKLWMYLAIFDQQQGNNIGAQAAILQAENYGSVPQALVTNIKNNLSFTLGVPDVGENIQIN